MTETRLPAGMAKTRIPARPPPKGLIENFF